MFFARRIEAMIEFFTLLMQLGCSYKGTGMSPVYDNDQLCRPLKKYLAEFVWRKLFGLQSYCVTFMLCDLLQAINVNVDTEINMADVGAQSTTSMEDLCSKSVDKFRKSDKIPASLINQVTQLYWHLDFAWRKQCLMQNIQSQMFGQENMLLRYRLILTAHFWMFEDILPAKSGFSVKTIDRSVIMNRLADAVQTITTLLASIKQQRNELGVLKTAIDHRLKWAAGANPNLSTLMTQFSEETVGKDNFIDQIEKLVRDVLTHGMAVLRYEELRSTRCDEHEDDRKFLTLIGRWEKMCMMTSCMTVITPIEEGLIELLDPEGPIDHIWLSHVAALINDMIEQLQTEIDGVEKTLTNLPDELQSCAYHLRNLMVAHHRVAPKVLGVINSVYQFVDATQQAIIDKYIEQHQMITETIDELQSHIMSQDLTEEIVSTSLDQITVVIDEIAVIFDGLVDLDGMVSQSVDNKSRVAQLQQQEGATNRPDSPSRPKAQKGEQDTRVFFQSFTLLKP